MTLPPARLPAAPAGSRIIPPFRDGHLHFFQDGKPLTLEGALAALQEYARRGIFALLDMGSREGTGLRVKEALHRDPDPFPDLKTGGYALHKRGGYGNFLGRGLRGRKEIRETVAALSRQGVDFLKVVHSGIVSLKNPGQITSAGFSRDELQCLVEEAQRYRLPVHCHVNSDPAIREAALLPIAGIHHGFFISEETLHILKEKAISWTPTLYALDHLKEALPLEQKRALEKIVDRHLASVSRASELGLPLRIGTDSGSQGVKPGRSFLAELALFQKAGLNLEQILPLACLEPEEISKGNYLVVKDDFVLEGTIEAVFRQGKPWLPIQGRAMDRGAGVGSPEGPF